MTVVYDAGALIAADRSVRQLWADHRARLELGAAPLTTAAVVAQVSRSPQQVQLRRFLRGCHVVPFAPEHAHEVGALAGIAGSSDVVDVHMLLVASKARVPVLSSDGEHLAQIAAALPTPVAVLTSEALANCDDGRAPTAGRRLLVGAGSGGAATRSRSMPVRPWPD